MTELAVGRPRRLRLPQPNNAVPRVMKSRSGWVGLLLGFAAATAGVHPLLGPLRPWHLFVLLAVAVSVTGRANRKYRVHAVEWALFGYVAIRVIAELINSTELHYSANWVSLIYPLWWWLVFVAAKRSTTDIAHAVTLLRAFCVPFIVLIPLAIGQALGVAPVLDFTAQYVDSEGLQARVLVASQLRAVGLVGHWTHYGIYCAALLTVAFVLLLLARRHRLGGVAFPQVTIVAGLVGLASSITFAPVFVVALVAIVSFRRIGLSLPTVIAMGAGVVGATAFLGAGLEERIAFQATGSSRVAWLPDWVPSTIGYRIYIWTTETLPMISDRPTTGWGLGVYEGTNIATYDVERTYPAQLRWLSAESQWFHELMASGVVGLVALTLVILAMLSLLRSTPEQPIGDFVAPLRAFVIALVIAALTAPMVTNKGAPLVLWAALGAVAALRTSRERRSPVVRARTSDL
ncbi:O-antigen ligase family protein [Microbacterium lushaniae]|nr:O-antigen ligase family protein [Microbacterium lushaniae]KAA9159875.1 O-antigen ligase family protein [Microbacterium lushaniae]